MNKSTMVIVDADKLFKACKERKISMKALCEAAGFSRSYLGEAKHARRPRNLGFELPEGYCWVRKAFATFAENLLGESFIVEEADISPEEPQDAATEAAPDVMSMLIQIQEMLTLFNSRITCIEEQNRALWNLWAPEGGEEDA